MVNCICSFHRCYVIALLYMCAIVAIYTNVIASQEKERERERKKTMRERVEDCTILAMILERAPSNPAIRFQPAPGMSIEQSRHETVIYRRRNANNI